MELIVNHDVTMLILVYDVITSDQFYTYDFCEIDAWTIWLDPPQLSSIILYIFEKRIKRNFFRIDIG